MRDSSQSLLNAHTILRYHDTTNRAEERRGDFQGRFTIRTECPYGMIEYVLYEGNRARRERQVWRSGVGFLLLSVILNTHMLVRSFVREPGTRTGRHPSWASMGIHDGREIIGRVDRHSIVTRARPSERRSVRAVRFFSLIFLRRVRFCDGRSARTDRSKKGLRRESSINSSLWGLSVLATDRFDPIRSDPTRSFASPVRSERRRTAPRVGFVSSR